MKWQTWLVVLMAAVAACGVRARPAQAAAAMVAGAMLTKEQLRVEGMSITLLPTGERVSIAPLPVHHYECEGALTPGEPGWRGDFLLPKTAWVYRGLNETSLVVTLASDKTTRLERGKDYLIDPAWGSLNAAPGSAYAPGTKLHFAYDYTASRLDLVARTADGQLVVKQGREDMSEPLLPELDPGGTPVFSVYLPHNATALSVENVQIIDPAYRGVPPV